MLWQRIVFGVLMLAATVGLFVADGWLGQRWLERSDVDGSPGGLAATLARGGLTTFLVLVLSQLALAELFRLAKGAGYRPLTVWPHLAAGVLVLLPWLKRNGWLRSVGPDSGDLAAAELALSVFLVGMIGLMILRRRTDRALSDLGIALFGVVYLGFFASFVIRLRCAFPGAAGAGWVLYFIVVTKFMDIGGYLVGRKMGRTRLIPEISPGKSVEGSTGGVVLSLVVGLAGGWAIPALIPGAGSLSLVQILMFSGVMAIVGLLGDLAISLIKRDVGRKDSGRVVPSYGGLLDIVDSPVLTAPVAWWLLTIWLVLD